MASWIAHVCWSCGDHCDCRAMEAGQCYGCSYCETVAEEEERAQREADAAEN